MAKIDFSPETLKARFHELNAEIRAIEEKSLKVRAARDKFVQRQDKERAKRDAEVRKAEEGLFDKKQELAMIARAVKNVGTPDGEEATSE